MLKHEHGDDEQLRHYARLIGSRCAPRLLAELARSPAAPPSLRALATLFDPAVTNDDGTTPLPRGSKHSILGAIYCSARSLAVTTGAIAPDAAPDASGGAGMGGMMRGAADMQLDPADPPEGSEQGETAAADEDEAEDEDEDEGGDDEPSRAEAVDDGASVSVSMAAYALRIGRIREAQRARQQWSKLRSVSMFRSFGKKGGLGGGLGGGGLGAAVADAAAAADAAASPATAAPSPTPPPPPPPPGDVMGDGRGDAAGGGSCREDDDKVWRRERVRGRGDGRGCALLHHRPTEVIVTRGTGHSGGVCWRC